MKKPLIHTQPRNMVADITVAVAAERARISDILESPEAKGRESMAVQLALRSDMTADAAKDLLRTSAKSENPFERYMDRVGPSGVPQANDAHSHDEKSARIAELKAIGRAMSIAKGYTKAPQ